MVSNNNIIIAKLSERANNESSANTQVKIKVCLFSLDKVRQKQFLRVQITAMQTNQVQSECPEVSVLFSRGSESKLDKQWETPEE